MIWTTQGSLDNINRVFDPNFNKNAEFDYELNKFVVVFDIPRGDDNYLQINYNLFKEELSDFI